MVKVHHTKHNIIINLGVYTGSKFIISPSIHRVKVHHLSEYTQGQSSSSMATFILGQISLSKAAFTVLKFIILAVNTWSMFIIICSRHKVKVYHPKHDTKGQYSSPLEIYIVLKFTHFNKYTQFYSSSPLET